MNENLEKRVRKLPVAFTLLLGLVFSVESLGNTLYDQQEYEAYGDQIKDQLRQYPNNPDLMYNLGNTYLKSNNLSGAIACYMASMDAGPVKPDVSANLRFAVGKIHDKLDVKPPQWWRQWLQSSFGYFSFRTWMYICCAGALCAGVLFSISGRSESLLILKGLSILFICIFACIAGLRLGYEAIKYDVAAILQDGVSVKSGPADGATNLFTLNEGAPLFVEDMQEDNSSGIWYKILISDGKRGWVSSQDIRQCMIF